MNLQTEQTFFFLFIKTFFVIPFLACSGRGLPSKFFLPCSLPAHYSNMRARMRVPVRVLPRWTEAGAVLIRHAPRQARAGRACPAASPGGHIPRRNAPYADATGGSEAPGFLLFSGLKCLERRLFFIFLREKMRKTKKADGFRPPALNNSISKSKYASLKY